MIVSKENILDFIPHRAPFVMVDGLVAITEQEFESELFIDADNILVHDGVFQESGLMENIAQTCAASFSFLDRQHEGKPKIGFIGAISRVTVHALPPHSSKINTVVRPTHQLGNIFMVTGYNYLDGKLLLECEMKIVTT